MIKKLLYFCLALLALISAGVFYAKLPIKNALPFTNFISSHVASTNSFPDSDEELKVITYNIGYASGKLNNKAAQFNELEIRKNLAEMAQALRDLDADVIFLQEVDFNSARTFGINQAQYFADALAMPYSASVILWSHNYLPWPYWPPSINYGRIVSGQAVLSKHPILKQEIIPFAKPLHYAFWFRWFYPERALQKLEIQIGEAKISAYNIHFEAKHAAARLEQAKILVEKINTDPAQNKIVAGDFNSVSFPALKETDKTPEAFDYILAHTQLKNAEASPFVLSNRNTASQWQPFQKIDHILTSPNFELQSMGNRVCEGSDHLPIWTEFGF